MDILSGLGAEVEEVSVPLAPWGRVIFYTHMYVEMTARYDDWISNRLLEFDYDAQVRFLTGSLVPGQYYTKVQRLRSLLRRQVHGALSKYDVLVSPTMRVPAPRIRPNVMPASKEDSKDLLVKGPDQTPMVPLSNVPAMSIPCGFASQDRGGMPIGLQIIGRPFQEAAILGVAYAYERATPWHKRRPDL